MEGNNGTTKDLDPFFISLLNIENAINYNLSNSIVTGQDKNAQLRTFKIKRNCNSTSYNTTWFVPTIEISGDHFKNISFLFLDISPGGKFKTKCGE
jgi:hypothetical protein